ncbi:MAG: peptidoglycan recognition protein family protein [Candidatus Pacearchaeota archaeon]|nr:peptidoglycan recognition protein family protein [Candidatus Pacearchaeota archaeon]
MSKLLSGSINKTDTLDVSGLRINTPEYLVLHSTRNYPRFEDVLNCHKGKKWAGMGYHLFLSDKGILTQGRPFGLEGAHALGFNTNSIGFCIYSSDGLLNQHKIFLSREVIKSLQKQFGNLKIIPHTLAQVIYNNRLLAKEGFNTFPEEIGVAYNHKFANLKKGVDNFVGKLNTQNYSGLKNSLKSLKNCPGEMFYNFI